MPSLASAILICLLLLIFLYYLRLTYPRDHHHGPYSDSYSNPHNTHQHTNSSRKSRRERDKYEQTVKLADFMDQVGTRMLEVDALEQKMAWQRLQTDLVLRSGRGGSTATASTQAYRTALAALDTLRPEPDNAFLREMYELQDKEAASNRKEREKYVRSVEDRLVDRLHAAFSLAPDAPYSYNGVQVPFSVEEYRDYIAGFSHDDHREFKRDRILENIRGGGRRDKGLPKYAKASVLHQHLEEEVALPDGDYLVWATGKYLKYSRIKGRPEDESSEDEGEEELPAGLDGVMSAENFKMYPQSLPISATVDPIRDYGEYDRRNNKHAKEGDMQQVHQDRLASDPQYLKPRSERGCLNMETRECASRNSSRDGHVK